MDMIHEPREAAIDDRLTAGNVTVVNQSERLSDLQENILRYVLRRYKHIETHANAFWCKRIGYWGVPWRPFGNRRPNASERAAMSRALRRLEARGLVQRRNSHSGDRWQEHGEHDRPPVTRTVCVKLTPEGRQLAERLTKETRKIVNPRRRHE